ncbi:UV DNA damage repair endonuclease UvsE [Terrihabitans rhizophilus]|uniref:UV DNA damage repair endonuclease UvsE n=1 Tax=Terrihabitans rhizophilus TaxID=3092662 RepID=A0ABU4RI71_9HYPH|nr:UV DNA damage repair endonuclease UvsE [Terrihabitans sp. PJ23]MDX6804529.1 UV DNA damage repair endonuclease UvsE [Terrihabitans sp. PJ23]
MTSPARLGFCCKFIPEDGDPLALKRMNMASTTISALSRLDGPRVTEKLLGLARHNMQALRLQMEDVAARPPLQRLLRVVSSILPAYNHPLGVHYREPVLREEIERGFAEAGRIAREAGIRISMHPDQFCVLNSASDKVVENSLGELEYHTEVMRMMGLAGGWHPLGSVVNIHGGGRAAGTEPFRANLARLSEDCRNLLTVENDEVSFGLEDLLPLADVVPIVVDFHHHWIASRGEYILPDDPRLDRVRESWRGVRPLTHTSVSREGLLAEHDPDVLPDFNALLAAGITARDLRGHSDMMWNRALNRYIAGHLAWADVEVEAKMKNLASSQLAAQVEALAA